MSRYNDEDDDGDDGSGVPDVDAYKDKLDRLERKRVKDLAAAEKAAKKKAAREAAAAADAAGKAADVAAETKSQQEEDKEEDDDEKEAKEPPLVPLDSREDKDHGKGVVSSTIEEKNKPPVTLFQRLFVVDLAPNQSVVDQQNLVKYGQNDWFTMLSEHEEAYKAPWPVPVFQISDAVAHKQHIHVDVVSRADLRETDMLPPHKTSEGLLCASSAHSVNQACLSRMDPSIAKDRPEKLVLLEAAISEFAVEPRDLECEIGVSTAVHDSKHGVACRALPSLKVRPRLRATETGTGCIIDYPRFVDGTEDATAIYRPSKSSRMDPWVARAVMVDYAAVQTLLDTKLLAPAVFFNADAQEGTRRRLAYVPLLNKDDADVHRQLTSNSKAEPEHKALAVLQVLVMDQWRYFVEKWRASRGTYKFADTWAPIFSKLKVPLVKATDETHALVERECLQHVVDALRQRAEQATYIVNPACIQVHVSIAPDQADGIQRRQKTLKTVRDAIVANPPAHYSLRLDLTYAVWSAVYPDAALPPVQHPQPDDDVFECVCVGTSAWKSKHRDVSGKFLNVGVNV